MKALNKHLTYATSTGQQVQHGDVVVTPVSRVLTLKLPHYVFIWNRPVAILVEDGDTSTRMPIVDVTLLAQLALLAIGVTLAILTALLGRARTESDKH